MIVLAICSAGFFTYALLNDNFSLFYQFFTNGKTFASHKEATKESDLSPCSCLNLKVVLTSKCNPIINGSGCFYETLETTDHTDFFVLRHVAVM